LSARRIWSSHCSVSSCRHDAATAAGGGVVRRRTIYRAHLSSSFHDVIRRLQRQRYLLKLDRLYIRSRVRFVKFDSNSAPCCSSVLSSVSCTPCSQGAILCQVYYLCYISAVLAMALHMSVCLSVRPYVRLSVTSRYYIEQLHGQS